MGRTAKHRPPLTRVFVRIPNPKPTLLVGEKKRKVCLNFSAPLTSPPLDRHPTRWPSSKGNYISANVTVRLESGEEVKAIYEALKTCKTVRFII